MIIGISGKKQHGKDTVADIIQYLTSPLDISKTNFEDFKNNFGKKRGFESSWQKKQFAYKLKKIVCELIGCTMEQLESNDFKEKPLGLEWLYWEGKGFREEKYLYATNEEAISAKVREEIYSFSGPYQHTPRTLLQLIGTEAGRNIIHPNIWVNALMADYKPLVSLTGVEIDHSTKTVWKDGHMTTSIPVGYPNWIISDVRFPNETKAIKDREGIIIRVNRFGMLNQDIHESETALDDYKNFDGVIENNSDYAGLVDQLEILLSHYKIIK